MYKLIIKRWCGGDKDGDMTKQINNLFNDKLKRAEIFEMGSRYKQIQSKIEIVPTMPKVQEQKQNQNHLKSVLNLLEKEPEVKFTNNVNAKKVVVEEKKEEVKELPVIGQFLLTKLVEKNITTVENKSQKIDIKKVNQEQVGYSKEYLVNTLIQVATLIYNSQGGALAFASGLYKLWASSSQTQKELSIKAGFGAVAYVVKRPWNWFCRAIGRHKWKIGSGTVGGELGLEVTKHLNDQGVTIVALDNGKNMLVNNNVKHSIQANIDRMVDEGCDVSTPMVETMLREGKALDLTKATLEPFIRGFSPEKQAEILSLDIYSSDIATQHINIEQVPSILQRSVDGVENVTNYANQIISAEGSLGGGFTWVNLVVGIVVIGGSLYAGSEIFKAVSAEKSEGLVVESVKFFWGVKDKVTGMLFSLFGLGFVYKAQTEQMKLQEQQKQQQEKTDNDRLAEVNGDDDDLV